jgi:hypothetical protein
VTLCPETCSLTEMVTGHLRSVSDGQTYPLGNLVRGEWPEKTPSPRPTRLPHTVLKEDSRGARPAKEHKDSKRRINAAVAAVMAHHRAAILAGDGGPSIYV